MERSRERDAFMDRECMRKGYYLYTQKHKTHVCKTIKNMRAI